MSAKSYRSVWNALEDTPAEAANMKVRAELLIAIQERVRKQKGTQAEKAERLGVTQPRLNDLLRGRIDKFSLDSLVNIADRAGLQIDLRIRRAA
ncbi:MAG: XRE family transcriptional regulator [Gammaproteobacteria bacterium]|nr:MAG: XRE family transcriptional regulator [Gammaproteobacteria bacterium]